MRQRTVIFYDRICEVSDRSRRAEAPVSLGCPPLVASVGGREAGRTVQGSLWVQFLFPGSTSVLGCWCIQSSSRQGAGRRERGWLRDRRDVGEHLPGFPATGAVREKAEISLVFAYDDSSLQIVINPRSDSLHLHKDFPLCIIPFLFCITHFSFSAGFFLPT